MVGKTLREIAAEFPYITLHALRRAAYEGRIDARKSGYVWLTTAGAIEEAIVAGRLRINLPMPARFWQYVDEQGPGECWEWMGGRSRRGYGKFQARSRRSEKAHRVAWELTSGEIPEGLCVCHHCDNPPCCNPNHLFLGTELDNARDCQVKSRKPSKLSWPAVREMRVRIAAGEKQRALAIEYDVSEATVSLVANKLRWWPEPEEKPCSK